MRKESNKQSTPRNLGNQALGRSSRSKALNNKKKTKPKRPTGDRKEKRISALDAAAIVLKRKGKPMQCAEIIVEMSKQRLWSSPAGKTPSATLYSALLREIVKKGRNSRFKKTERGKFAFNKA